MSEDTRFQDDELTDVGSLCSGLSDLSGVSDLDEDLDAMHSDEGPEEVHLVSMNSI